MLLYECCNCEEPHPWTEYLSVKGKVTKNCSQCRGQPARTSDTPYMSSPQRRQFQRLHPYDSTEVQERRGHGDLVVSRSRRDCILRREKEVTETPSEEDEDETMSELTEEPEEEVRRGNKRHTIQSAAKSAAPFTRSSFHALNTTVEGLKKGNESVIKQLKQVQNTLTQLTSAGQTSSIPHLLSSDSAETTARRVKDLYFWIDADLSALVGQDRLRPEELYRLRVPTSVEKAECAARDSVAPPTYQPIRGEEGVASILLFTQKVPSIKAFAQLWTVYMTVRSFYVEDKELIRGYSFFLSRLMELPRCDWHALAQYIVAVLRDRFGRNEAKIWTIDSQSLLNKYLSPASTSLGRP